MAAMLSSLSVPVYNRIALRNRQSAELSAVEHREEIAVKKIVPEYKINNKGHYSPGILSNGMLYISGQLSRDPDTGVVASGGAREHAQLALANMERVLLEAGLSKENVVQCRVFISDIDMWDEVNEAYSEFCRAQAGEVRCACGISISDALWYEGDS